MKGIKHKYFGTSLWIVTGTFHGSWVYAKSEGEARRTFHKEYNGESIIHIYQRNYLPI